MPTGVRHQNPLGDTRLPHAQNAIALIVSPIVDMEKMMPKSSEKLDEMLQVTQLHDHAADTELTFSSVGCLIFSRGTHSVGLSFKHVVRLPYSLFFD